MKALAYLVFLTFLPPRPAPSMERLRQQRRLVPRRPRRATESYPALATQVARLGNGQYSVLLAATGDGASECGGMAVSRWSPDRTTCVDGFHVFLRDLEDDFVWSAGYQPMRVQPDAYEFRFSASLAEIVRVDRDVACRLAVCVAPDHDFELRWCRLTNLSDRPRPATNVSSTHWLRHGQCSRGLRRGSGPRARCGPSKSGSWTTTPA